ncbi:GntR family transcriptional regulator [soil metagenome]|jgi:DNA-binding transcriptional regulator YhcF (GntR family)
MILEIDPRSPVPPYEQVRQQVTALVLGGALPVDARLPSIRQLANDLGLASGTVARAYRELETDGVVETRGRHGTTVSASPHQAAPAPALLDAAGRYATLARHAGVSVEDAVTALRVAFATRATRGTT